MKGERESDRDRKIKVDDRRDGEKESDRDRQIKKDD